VGRSRKGPVAQAAQFHSEAKYHQDGGKYNGSKKGSYLKHFNALSLINSGHRKPFRAASSVWPGEAVASHRL
jgi:hypothetical protein